MLESFWTDNQFKEIILDQYWPALEAHPKWLRQFVMPVTELSQIHSGNFVKYYIAFCRSHKVNPLEIDTLLWVFRGCIGPEDFYYTLKLTLKYHGELHYMQPINDDVNKYEVLTVRLRFRLALFRRVPTATNMILAYGLIEELTMLHYKQNKLDVTDATEKAVDRFEKLKNLALSTKFIAERKTAFERSFDVFKKLTSFKEDIEKK